MGRKDSGDRGGKFHRYDFGHNECRNFFFQFPE